MFRSRNNSLDALLKARKTEDSQSSWRRRYSWSPSLQFFLVSSLYKAFRCYNQPPQPESLDLTNVRLVCVSDTHNHLLPPASIPPGDIFIHAGDLTNSGSLLELVKTLDWIRSLPHSHKIIIAGNHDTAFANQLDRNELDFTGLHYICNETMELQIRARKISVYGSPWTPRFGNFAFQYPKQDGATHWERIPDGVDVLVTHGPAYAHCDNDGLGCESLLQHVWRVRPKIMVCGHIHAGRGIEKLEWDETQRYWESIVKQRKEASWWDVVVMACKLSWSWVKSANSGEGYSTVVNCAVVGGIQDQLIRKAIVIDI